MKERLVLLPTREIIAIIQQKTDPFQKNPVGDTTKEDALSGLGVDMTIDVPTVLKWDTAYYIVGGWQQTKKESMPGEVTNVNISSGIEITMMIDMGGRDHLRWVRTLREGINLLVYCRWH